MAARTALVLGPARPGLADAAGLAAYALHPQAAARTARNHLRAAGGRIGAREARRRARASFREYGRMAADTLAMGAVGPETLLERTVIEGWERVESAREAGGGAILAMCHFGNWDVALGVGLARRLPIATVMAPVGPAWLTDVVAWKRRRRGLELLELDGAARGFLRRLRAGGMVGVMIDIPESGPAAEVEFCGGPVAFSAVAAWLAARSGAPIIPADCRRVAPGRHRLEVHGPIRPLPGEDEAAVTARVARALEPAVLRSPEQWYPFHEVYADAGRQRPDHPGSG